MALSLLRAVTVVSLVVLGAVNAADFGDNSLSGNANPRVCRASKLKRANGEQKETGTCSSTQLGEIPGANKMISTIILKPRDGQRIPASKSFDVEVKINNLDTGFFSDPAKTYYSFSQQLNNQGVIKGHSHVVIQKLNSRSSPPDARNFEFFLGLNGVAEGGGGVLATSVADGLPTGLYRLCSMTAAFSHQPVLMPLAQRGPQDDCIRFRVQ